MNTMEMNNKLSNFNCLQAELLEFRVVLAFLLQIRGLELFILFGKMGIELASSSWSCPWSELGKKKSASENIYCDPGH